jgi:DNA-binding CsgD family transcriptional regulator
LKAARKALSEVPTTTDNRVNLTFARAAGTAVGTYLGDDALIQTWFDDFDEGLDSVTEIECGYGFAEVLARRGRVADAQAVLHRVLPECELVRGQVLTLLAIARYGATEDRARAREYLARAAEGSDGLERSALALFDALSAVEADSAEGKRLASEAAVGFRRLGTPLLEAAALEVAGDPEAALALYRRCGAAYHVERLTGAIASPIALRQLEQRPELAVLSSREREIVALAADGQSNLEIARSLSISHKTVEKHLGSAFQKLGVSSRRELRPSAAGAR